MIWKDVLWNNPHGGNGFRSRRFIQFAHIKLTYIFAIFFPSLADSKRAFLALPCRESIRRLSASASWESHPRALARTLSCKYHHSSRLSSPPSGAVPQRSDFHPMARRSLGGGSAVPDQLVWRWNAILFVKEQKQLSYARTPELSENTIHDDYIISCQRHR